MEWEDLPYVIADWVEKVAAAGLDVRLAAADVYPTVTTGYYYDPVRARVAIHAPGAPDCDLALAKYAAARATGLKPLFLTYHDLADPDETWVKVAYSRGLRALGEALNFFPGQYPGGIPNHPSPVAAMLTSGLVGAGLGWAGGRALGAVLPGEYGKKLSRTGLVLGGLAGAAPGALWAGTNKLVGAPLNSPHLLGGPAGGDPADQAGAADGTNSLPGSLHSPDATDPTVEALRGHLANAPPGAFKLGSDVPLGRRYLAAVEKVADTFGRREPRLPPTPADVNIDALGRTLWETGASPALAATTMAGMYAAQQLPDPNARPGWATGRQLGQLTLQAVGDYAKGYLAGAAINAVVGTPHKPSSFGAANAVLGVLGAVVPRLFGG